MTTVKLNSNMMGVNFGLGTVLVVQDGVAKVSGLNGVRSGELVKFKKCGVGGIVMGLLRDSVSVTILGSDRDVHQGELVERQHEVVKVPVGYSLLGRIVDGIGNLVDTGEQNLTNPEKVLVEVKAPGVITRQPVREPLSTGILALDSIVPVGRGQRQLIIGDRQTGKTVVALDTIINQRHQDAPVICVYVAIGQKRSSVSQIAYRLKKEGAAAYTIIVAATASESAALQYLAPYTATAIAEYFRDSGQAVLIIYDDLTKHAVAYRQISLLLRRAPGREAFPGDVFYLHSRLLERSAKLNKIFGSGSLTALPIVETQLGDVSAYIPTNVISITDGQTFLDSNLFNRAVRPAINVGLSVSRVGAAAQPKCLKEVSRSLKLNLAQFREVESYKALGADLDASTRLTLDRGERLVELLKQDKFAPISSSVQIALLYFGTKGYSDRLSLTQVKIIKYIVIRLASISNLFESKIDPNRSITDAEEFLIDFFDTLTHVLTSSKI